MGPTTIIAICRGILLDRVVRRKVMIGSIVTAAALVCGLMVVPNPFWRDHPWLFFITLLACGWMTVLAFLLALYDMLSIRAESRKARKSLKTEVFGNDANHRQPPSGK